LNISPIEQQIYNNHLKYLRSGQAWKPRKDFSGLDQATLNYLQKLKNFFYKFSHIKIEDFFFAPSFLHPEDPPQPLKFFTTRAAIKCYNLYKLQQFNLSPSHQEDSIKEGFKYIAKFCLENKILVEDYISFKIGIMPAWMEHYRLHLVNPYSLMEIISNRDLEVEADEAELWIPRLKENFTAFKMRYHNSPETKQLCKRYFEKIKTIVSSELKTTIS
jgi:hypothetical protein